MCNGACVNKAKPGELYAGTFPKGAIVETRTLWPSGMTIVVVKEPPKVKPPVDARA